MSTRTKQAKPRTRDTTPGLHIFLRGKTYYLRGTIAGQRIFESLRTDSKAIAEEARINRQFELQRHAVHGTKPEVTFAAAAAAYLEHEQRSGTTRAYVRKLLLHFGERTTCRDINQDAVDRAGKTICPKAKPQSVRRQVVTPLTAILSFASRRGWCAPPHFEVAKGGGRRTDWITPAEAEAMIAGAADHLHPMLTFMFCTGARVGEMLSLDWRDVNLQYAQVTLRDTKNGDDRRVALPPRAVAALAGIPHREGAVFQHPVQGQRAGKPVRMTPYRQNDDAGQAYGGQIKKGWHTAREKAGIARHVTPHHARHSWSTWHYALHRDIMKLRDAGGWRTVAMVERYAKTPPDGLAEAVARFWGLPVGQDRRDERLTA